MSALSGNSNSSLLSTLTKFFSGGNSGSLLGSKTGPTVGGGGSLPGGLGGQPWQPPALLFN